MIPQDVTLLLCLPQDIQPICASETETVFFVGKSLFTISTEVWNKRSLGNCLPISLSPEKDYVFITPTSSGVEVKDGRVSIVVPTDVHPSYPSIPSSISVSIVVGEGSRIAPWMIEEFKNSMRTERSIH